MLRKRIGLRRLVAVSLPAAFLCACGTTATGDKGQKPNNKDVPKIEEVFEAVDNTAEVEAVDVPPDVQKPGKVQLLSVHQISSQECACPKNCGCPEIDEKKVSEAGKFVGTTCTPWYVVSKANVKAFARLKVGDEVVKGGIDRVKITYLNKADKDKPLKTIVTATKADKHGWFDLSFLFKEKKKFFENKDGEVVDGLYNLTVQAEAEPFPPATRSLKMVLDRTGPEIKEHTFVGKEDSESCPRRDLSVEGGTFLQELSWSACIKDAGVGIANVRFYLGKKELTPVLKKCVGSGTEEEGRKSQERAPGEPAEEESSQSWCLDPTRGERWVFDISNFMTQDTEFRVEAEDCLGNISELVHTVHIYGPPRYERPPVLKTGGDTGVGKVVKLRSVKFRSCDPVTTPKDYYSDLLITGEEGIGISIFDDQEGNFMPVERLIPITGAKDALMSDVNRDGALDLLVLLPDKVHIYLQRTTIEWESSSYEVKPTWSFTVDKVKEGEPRKGESESELSRNETILRVPVEPEVLPVKGGPALGFAVTNMNPKEDDLEDILVVLPGPEPSLTVFLHTGREYEPPPPPTKPGKEKRAQEELDVLSDSEVPQEPELTPWFTFHASLTGPLGIVDFEVGQFNQDDYPDVVMIRSDGGITLAVTDGFGGFPNASYTSAQSALFPGCEIAASFDLLDDNFGLTDLVVYSPTSKAAHVLRKNEKDNYFSHVQALAASKLEDPDLDPVLAFGRHFVANVIPHGLIGMDFNRQGIVASLDDKPSEMLLADIVGTPGSGQLDTVPDLIAAIPSLNRIAIYRGSYSQEMQNMIGQGYVFEEHAFIIPGRAPQTMLVEDFNGDSRPDIVCSVDDGDTVALLYNSSVEPGLFEAPMEIALPLTGSWNSAGRLTPAFMQVGDLDSDGDTDVVVVTDAEPQDFHIPASGCASDEHFWLGDWSNMAPEQLTSKSLPIVLTYLFNNGVPADANGHLSVTPLKSPVDVAFDQTVNGVALGDFNGDGIPDMALSSASSSDNACTGRNFEILIGGQRVNGIYCPELLGSNHTWLYFYNVVKDSGKNAGYFRPMGGYQGITSLIGLAAGQLNDDGLADLVLLADKVGTPGNKGYHLFEVQVLLTRYDTAWNKCAKMAQAKEVWFDCAPLFPLAMAQSLAICSPEGKPLPKPAPGPGGGGQEPHPAIEIGCPPTPDGGQETMPCDPSGVALPAESLDKVFSTPAAALIANFNMDESPECNDLVVANQSGELSFGLGDCDGTSYTFSSQDIFTIGPETKDLKSADLDGDTYPDVVAAQIDRLAVAYSSSYGTTFDYPCFIMGDDPTESFAPSSVVVQDVNDDGFPDLLAADPSEDNLLVFVNTGPASAEYRARQGKASCRIAFRGPVKIPVGLNPKAVAVADMDQDGCKDLVVMNEGSRSITVLRSDWCD